MPDLSELRMCVNCGRTKPASEDRHEPLPECVGPDGYAACTFDLTPQEAWEHWRGEAHRLRARVKALEQDRDAAEMRAERAEDSLIALREKLAMMRDERERRDTRDD